MRPTHDLNVLETQPLSSPDALTGALPITPTAAEVVYRARQEIRAVLRGDDPRLLVVVGPCSVHDPAAAIEYAERFLEMRRRHEDELLLVMRVYFEKPRTSLGWKGLINDPHLNGSCDIAEGLTIARKLLLALADRGVPAATEMLDPIIPQYLADLVSWTAIGARTTESQTHREMASGLSMPVGYKNGTDGSLSVAIHALIAALAEAGVQSRVLIDCSHDNSGKSHLKQPDVVDDVARQVAGGSPHVLGAMIESNLVGGRQKFEPGVPHPPLVYGQSITDACVDMPTTERMLEGLARAKRGTRQARVAE
jgi:3-deoxy-7-phosphoheptulonate synthase